MTSITYYDINHWERIAKASRRTKGLKNHPWPHTRRVIAYSLWLMPEVFPEAFPDVQDTPFQRDDFFPEDGLLGDVIYERGLLPVPDPDQIGDTKVADVLLAGLFHDTGRLTDGRDFCHGYRSRSIFRNRRKHLPDGIDAQSIEFAILHHADFQDMNGGLPVPENYDVSSQVDKRISTILWDADRLDLARDRQVGALVDPNYFTTQRAKIFVNTPEHAALYRK